MNSQYDTAQICLNGHVINAQSRLQPSLNQPYCDKCGERTITVCPQCQIPIRGQLYNRAYKRVAYCHFCGKPFPWTSAGLAAAEKLADMLESLNAGEREELKSSLPDLMAKTPSTPFAEVQFKRLMKKAGGGAVEAMKRILIDVVSESVRKTLFGG